LGFVGGIVDADAAGERSQIAVEIVDREDAQIDRVFGLRERRRAGEGNRQGKDGAKEQSHDRWLTNSTSLREANGSRERAPGDRLSDEEIQLSLLRHSWIASLRSQ